MTGKSHLITAASTAVIADTGFKLISDFIKKQDLFTACRNYVTCGIAEDISFEGVVMLFICAFLFFIGSVLPDIDSEKSAFGKYARLPVKHRTFTHSVFFITPFLILGIFLWRPLLWLSFGMISHLFCDSFSKAGVCWFWPLSGYKNYDSGAFVKKGYHLKLYGTGEWSEYLWVAVSVVIALFLIIKAYIIPMLTQGINPVFVY